MFILQEGRCVLETLVISAPTVYCVQLLGMQQCQHQQYTVYSC
jgi:hypothetical protein